MLFLTFLFVPKEYIPTKRDIIERDNKRLERAESLCDEINERFQDIEVGQTFGIYNFRG